MKRYTKNKIIVAGIISFFLVIMFYNFSLSDKNDSKYETATAKIGDINQEINVTGTIKPEKSVNLSFLSGGEVKYIYVDVGDLVKKGDPLISLDSRELSLKLNEAIANKNSLTSYLESQKALKNLETYKLEDMINGTTKEELDLYKTKVINAENILTNENINLKNVKTKAENDLLNLYKNTNNILNDAYTKADDALNKQIISLFNESSPANFKLSFDTKNQSLKFEVEDKRKLSSNKLLSIKETIENLKYSTTSEDSLINTKNNLIYIRDFFIKLSLATDEAINLSSNTINTYKGYINTALTNINTSISNIDKHLQNINTQKITNKNNINSAKSKLISAENNLKTSKNELKIKQAGATIKQIQAQKQRIIQMEANISQAKAQIKQAEATINGLKIKIDKNTLYSPINGIITKQDAKIGENITTNKDIISIISKNNFKIETNITEVDIAKVKIGNIATVSLDAYGDDTLFEAKITKIDPAETIVEGVSTYKTTLIFIKENKMIKSGMTANLDIKTAERKNVLIIPQRAIINKNGNKIVRVLENSKIKEVKVKTGLKGSYGNIEIIDGLKEKDKVVIFIKNDI